MKGMNRKGLNTLHHQREICVFFVKMRRQHLRRRGICSLANVVYSVSLVRHEGCSPPARRFLCVHIPKAFYRSPIMFCEGSRIRKKYQYAILLTQMIIEFLTGKLVSVLDSDERT